MGYVRIFFPAHAAVVRNELYMTDCDTLRPKFAGLAHENSGSSSFGPARPDCSNLDPTFAARWRNSVPDSVFPVRNNVMRQSNQNICGAMAKFGPGFRLSCQHRTACHHLRSGAVTHLVEIHRPLSQRMPLHLCG